MHSGAALWKWFWQTLLIILETSSTPFLCYSQTHAGRAVCDTITRIASVMLSLCLSLFAIFYLNG